jgi:hypothetical protein
MVINKATICKIENTYMMLFSDDFRQYLLAKYGEEPLPYVFSEQDLYENIRKDIRKYKAGELNMKITSI